MNDHIATQAILARREALGLKVDDVAKATGIRVQTIRDLEKGRSVPKLDTFLLLCSTLDIEVQLVPREQLRVQQGAPYASQQEVLAAIVKLAHYGVGI